MDCSPEYVDNYFGVYDGELFDDDVDYIDDADESDEGYNTECNSATNLTEQTEPSSTTTSPRAISPRASPTIATSTTSSNSTTAASITSAPASALKTTTTTTTTTTKYTKIAKCHSFDQGGLFEYELVPRETLSMAEYMENYLEAFENLLKCMVDVQFQLKDANDKLAIIKKERNTPRTSTFQNCSTVDNLVTKNNNELARI